MQKIYLLTLIILMLLSSRVNAQTIEFDSVDLRDKGKASDIFSASEIDILTTDQNQRSDQVEIIFNLSKIADLHYQSGQWADALASWQQVMALDSLHEAGLLQLSKIFNKTGQYIESNSLLMRLTIAYPDNANYKKLLADNYVKLDLIDEAIVQYEAALEINPRDLESMTVLADLYYQTENYQKADQILSVTLNLYEDHLSAQEMKIKLCYTEGYFDHTRDLLEAFQATYDLSNSFKRLLSAIYYRDERYEDAIAAISEMTKPDRHEDATHVLRYNAYMGLEDYILARISIDEAIKACQHPKEGQYWAYKGNLLTETGMYRQAADAFHNAAVMIDDPLLYFLAARALDAELEFSRAKMSYFMFERNAADYEQQYAEELEYTRSRLKILTGNDKTTE